MEPLVNLEESLHQLKLHRLADRVDGWLQDAAKQEWGYA